MLDQPSSKQKVGVPVSSLYDLLQGHARRFAEAPAILAPDCAPLSYRRLYRHIDDVGRTLRAKGIGRDDRLAVLMPNGPELAVAIVAVAANAACASINPAYSAEELDRYFADLKPRALIVPGGVDGAARRVAQARGVPVFDLTPTGEAAGLSMLAGAAAGEPSSDPLGPGATALLLFTSGTTSRPKIVPLTHANICTSAFSAVAALQLSEADRCLNVLPLFHGHGLIATVMTSLAAGGGVVCTAGCDVNRFFGWLRDFAPTWYSAVPTMHQAILAQARLNPDQVAGIRLRLVRSASAPLPPRVFAELERTFGTSVIEFYGMTETASAPIACNPLPPRKSKPGSVGVPVGLDVAILNDRGDVLPAGQTGHVTVRGGSVMPGYDGDAAATAAAFAGDWFKTGDQGFFDDEGYLYLSGRTREMINRGGENIAPREVDEALLEHPAVAEAVTFAVPHATLGEDVAAAVVLRPNAAAMPKDIRQFAAGRLADFKVPRQVLIVEQLPKGSTGKVQRVGLAEKFGLGSAASRTFAAPRTPLENILAGIWAEVLRLEQVGIHDDFFALGGDLLLAAHVLTSIHHAMHLEVGVVSLFDAPTVAEMAEYLETLIKAGRAGQPEIARVSRNELLPASPAQERLWTLQQAVPDLPFFNILYALRVTSPLDAALLERSFNEIVDERIVEFCRPALETGLPLLRTKTNSYDTATQLFQLSSAVAADDLERTRAAVEHVAQSLDVEQLISHSKKELEFRLSPAAFLYQLTEKARAANKRIVLPEGTEPRTVKAGAICARRGIARCVLLGKPSEVQAVAKSLDLELPDNLEILDPALIRPNYVKPLFEARKHKGLSMEMAASQLEDNVVLGTMMVALGEVDGLVSGAVHSTAHTIRPALQIIKTKPKAHAVSSIFFMCLPEQVLVYGDCAVVPDPDVETLADIAIQSADSAKAFGIPPRVAMISYSTGESGSGADVDKVRAATKLAQSNRPDLLIDGPLQYDAAFMPDVAKTKAPDSPVAGRATVFIFPDLNTGNTTYKAVQRSANLISVGPMLQGLRRPVNDLSRGALVDDIVYTIALTAIQATQV